MKHHRHTALILIAVLFLTAISVTAAGGTAESDLNYAKLLYKTGILEEDYSDRLEQQVTRGEFAKILVNMLGISTIDTGRSQFSDVHPMSETGPFVLTVCEMGYMNGYGEMFGTDDPILCDQALSVLVRALGYGEYAQTVGEEKVFSLKKQLAGGADISSEPLTAQELLKMVYNALQADLMESLRTGSVKTYDIIEGKTLMNSVHKIYKVTGVVTANEFTKLASEEMPARGTAEIDRVKYELKDTELTSYIGSLSDAYVYREQPELIGEIRYIAENRRNETRTVDIGDFIKADEKNLYYSDDSGREKLDILNTANVIYNNRFAGKYYDFDTDALSDITCGSIVLKDADSDGVFETVCIYDIETDLISSYDAADSVLVCENGSYDLDGENKRVLITYDGENAKNTVLRENRAAEIIESGDGNAVVVNVLSKSVQGIVEGVSDTEVNLDGKLYEYIKKYNSSSFKVGNEIMLFLNDKGIVIYCKTFGLNGTWRYGAVSALGTGNGIDDTYSLKIFDSTGSFNTYTVRKKCKVDGESLSDMTRLETVFGFADNTAQLIKYKVNSNNEIINIDTEAPDASEDETNLKISAKKESLVYKRLSTLGSGKFYIDDETVIFSVPDDRLDYDKYLLFSKGSFENDKTYTVSVYDCDKYNIPGALVLHSTSSSVDTTSSVFVVEAITQGIYNDEQVYFLNGAYNNGISKNTFWFTSGGSCVPEVLPGDVIQISAYATGELSAYEVLCTDGTAYGASTSSGARNYSCGEIVRYDTKTGVCLINISQNDTPKLRISVLTEAKGYKVTSVRGQCKTEIASGADLIAGKRIYVRERYLEPKEYVVFE